MYHLKPKLCVACFCYIGIIIHILLFIIWVWKWDQQISAMDLGVPYDKTKPYMIRCHPVPTCSLDTATLQERVVASASCRPRWLCAKRGIPWNTHKNLIRNHGTLRFPFIFFQVDFDMLWPALSKWCWPFYDHFMVTLYTLVSWWRTQISSKSVANGKWLQTCLKYIPPGKMEINGDS